MKNFQSLFEKYTLSEEEQSWCRTFENSSGIEPIFTEEVIDQKTFIEMTRNNNRHLTDLTTDAIKASEFACRKLSYFEYIEYQEL